MKAVDVRTVARESLMDIRKVHMDKNLPKSERFADFFMDEAVYSELPLSSL